MTLTWTAPAALWLLAALPLVWLVPLVTRTSFNRRQRATQALVRSLLLVALALGLARPIISSDSSRQSVVYAVDISHSVATQAIEAAARKIDDLNAALRPEHARIVAFAASAMPVPNTDALRRLAKVSPPAADAGTIDRQGSDLEAGLLAARAALAPQHVPRIIVFTDGHATAGDTGAGVARLAVEGIPVSAEPLAVRSIGDVWIDTLELPERIAAGSTFPATVVVGSQREASGTIALRSRGTLLARQPAAFPPGQTRVTLHLTIAAPGSVPVEAALELEGDPLTANNRFTREAWVQPRSRVLYVEGTPASARYLTGALTGAGFDVTVRGPAGVPATRGDLAPFHVVILSDVSRAAITDAAMTALSEWVEQTGGGLLVAGGDAVFGEGKGGYRNTALERLTPVTFERRDEPEVALVIVLDRSWSMAGSSMDLTKTAAQAAVDVLADEQSVGILTFNDKFAWDVTLRNVGKNRDAIRKAIADIGPAGHTLIYPAVEQAYLALRDAEARAKHVILLSDGRSYPGEYEALVQRMVAARITLSTVAVGPSADPDLLRNLAQWGKGRDYTVADARQVPEIFVREAKNAATPGFDEKSIQPVVRTAGFLTGVDLAHLPPLKGRTATVLKEGATELLATDEEDPLLAFWPIGLGRTAVFASDVKDRWAADWVRWRGYGPFFAAVVRALEHQPPAALTLDLTPGPIRAGRRTVAIAVEARDALGQYRNLLTPVVEASTGSGRAVPVATSQSAPGRYEASLVADATQPLTIQLAGAEAGGLGVRSRTVLPDAAAEYRFRPIDEPLLRSIAAATGGSWRPSAGALATAPGDTRTERRALWPALILLALALWFVDLLLRRVRIFEPRAVAGT